MENYEKKYKEALKKAKSMIDDLRKGEDILAVSNLESMFPELAESEDEKIRKALIRYHQSTLNIDGIKGEDILAWLEKQGKPFDDKMLQAILVGLTDVVEDLGWSDFGGIPIEDIQEWLDKQENSPILSNSAKTGKNWTDGDEAHLHSITTHLEQWIERYPNTCGADIQWENIDWLKSLKKRMEES